MVRHFHTAWAESTVFYRAHRPRDHFRTSSHSSSRVARALARIVAEQWLRLGAPEGFTVTDVGADDGHLLASVRDLVPPSIREGARWRAVDLVAGGADVDWVVADITSIDLPAAPGVLIAQELLDDIPCPIVQNDDAGRPWFLGLDEDGATAPLTPVTDRDDLAWLATWWPDPTPVAMREIGRPRDVAWQRLRASVTAGLAIAIDYGHVRAERRGGRWAAGTVRAFQSGRVARPVPDGLRNITAHVAMDALADAPLRRQVEMTGIGGAEGDMLWLLDDRGASCAR